ncbi:outer membrane protein-like protein [Desulfobulbus propionicus DSM 2032]|uniref:Outer membrane protein-like protein n=1 Tax=Desulfobulbus propionicus (strain ATCC 33891 / DSM 2032 / VKM B-1956 / 1pr3) TaxID=577650 RepID=A0A7U3YMH0_DESPD|nr:TolC family protein [Desulfobulbus propionicus]ADW18104.1 outer membrane protein-like protein [Desulfobulbus propionicus DSM 2032]
MRVPMMFRAPLACRPAVTLLVLLVFLLCPVRLLAGTAESVHGLDELEGGLIRADEVQIAAADLEAGQAQLDQRQSEQGWKLFAGAGTGLTEDAALSGDDRRYTTYDVRAGLRRPLLGRADAERREVVEAQTSVREKEQQVRLARLQSLALLRQAYVTYWAAQEKQRLGQTFLAGEAKQRQLLTRRQQAGYLLEADRLEFLSSFDLVRRNQETLRVTQQTALHTIQRLTGISLPFIAQTPRFARPKDDLADLPRRAMDDFPAVALLRERLRGLEQQIPLTSHAGTSAHFDLYTAAGVDDGDKEPEYSLGVNFAVELPLGTIARNDNAAQRSAQTLAAKCRRELALERDNVRLRVEEAQALYRASRADLGFAGQRLQAAGQRVKENKLRIAMEGDTLEQLQQSRYAYYQASLDAVDAQARQYGQLITLLAHTPLAAQRQEDRRPREEGSPVEKIDPRLLGEVSAAGTEKQVVEAESPLAGRGVNTLYVWRSDRFRQQEQADSAFVPALRKTGVERLLLSLDQRQIDSLATPEARAIFSSWIERLHGQGITVELLLGEPSWILAQHRPRLVEIVASLADLPFAGLHLDLEIDQLDERHRRDTKMLTEWAATVEAARRASPWPVGVSLHPRTLKPNGKKKELGAMLDRLQVTEVVLMIYAANPQRVAEVATPILQAFPRQRFSVAQSVEPELSTEESHYQAGRAQFTARMTRLAQLLAAPNFHGLVVQDWSRWQEMQP